MAQQPKPIDEILKSLRESLKGKDWKLSKDFPDRPWEDAKTDLRSTTDTHAESISDLTDGAELLYEKIQDLDNTVAAHGESLGDLAQAVAELPDKMQAYPPLWPWFSIAGDVKTREDYAGLPGVEVSFKLEPDGPEWIISTDMNGHYFSWAFVAGTYTLTFPLEHDVYELDSPEKQTIVVEEGEELPSPEVTYYTLKPPIEYWMALLDRMGSELTGLTEDPPEENGFSITDWLDSSDEEREELRKGFIGEPETDADRYFLAQHVDEDELLGSIVNMYLYLDAVPAGALPLDPVVDATENGLRSEILPRLRTLFRVATVREATPPMGSAEDYENRRQRLEEAIETAETILNEVRGPEAGSGHG